jgi:PIN domain nuclease of toxin-antitoxin system
MLWLLQEDPRFRPVTREIVANPQNDVFVSAVTPWEIAIKARLGKLAVPPNMGDWLPAWLVTNRLTELPVSFAHAVGVEYLPLYHGDPFDRLLIAQARAENLTLVSTDAHFERYEVRLIRC